jgi:hypothetical protein
MLFFCTILTLLSRGFLYEKYSKQINKYKRWSAFLSSFLAVGLPAIFPVPHPLAQHRWGQRVRVVHCSWQDAWARVTTAQNSPSWGDQAGGGAH